MTRLIIIEGVDGSGKTTLARACMDALSAEGASCLSHHFPTIMWSDPSAGIDWASATQREKAHWFFKDFMSGLDRLLMQEPDYIVLDRSFISTLVYQGLDTQAMAEMPMLLHTLSDFGAFIFTASQRIKGVLFIHMDLPADVCAQRIVGRGAGVDEFDSMALDKLHQKVLLYKERYEIAFQMAAHSMSCINKTPVVLKFDKVSDVETMTRMVLSALGQNSGT